MKVAIVTDSTCDIPAELAAQYQIEIVPNILILDGVSLEDGVGISRQEFYNRLPSLKSLPTTAAPAVGIYQSVYRRLVSQGVNKILSIHAPSSLSGIMNVARLASQAFHGLVHLIDSGQVTLGLGFQVLAAAEAAAKNLPFDAIISLVKSVQERCRVLAMLDTLEFVHRSGRVSWAKARLGSLLEIKPIIELRHGKVISLGETRTRRKGMERLRELLYAMGDLERLAILHTNCEAEAQTFLDSLKVRLATAPLIINVTTIIGAHTGPNALGFAAVTS